MQVSVCFVNWNHVKQLDLNNELVDALCERDDTENWIRYPKSWWSDSSIQFDAVVSVWRKILPLLTGGNSHAAKNSIGKLFGSPFPNELRNPMDHWFIAISPTTIQDIVNNLEMIDFDCVANLFDQHCDEFERQTLLSYDDDFVGYCRQWQGAMDESASLSLGLLGHYG